MTVCTHHCISTPLAWFVIEQYRAGDLDRAAAAETAHHLANCAACAEVYAYIENDSVSLPPLPVRLGPQKKKRASLRVPYPIIIGLSAAAGLLFVLLAAPPAALKAPSPVTATKGGDLAISLVRLRGHIETENPTGFEDGDRFRLLLTTPYEDDIPIEVVVFQGNEAFFPYPTPLTAPPGNHRGVDGAFTLSGSDDALVCVIAGESIPPRETLEAGGPSRLPQNSVCQKLDGR